METDVRIVFTAGTHWISRLIRWVLRSEVSHVFIEYPSELWGGRWVAESTKGGVRKVQASMARHHVKMEYVCKFDIAPGLKSVAKYVGVKYDYVGALVMGMLALFWRWFKIKLKHPLRSSKAQFCSEFVSRALINALFINPIFTNTVDWDPEQSGPDDLLRFCRRHPELFGPAGEA